MVALLLQPSDMAERSAWRAAAVLAILLAGRVSAVRAEDLPDGARAAIGPVSRGRLASVVGMFDIWRLVGWRVRSARAPSETADARREAVVARAAWGCEE
jgi:hypothetical protein